MAKTYRIAICDDHVEMMNTIKYKIESYFSTSKSNLLINTYTSAEEFLISNQESDYLFLDVEMHGMSGIDLKEFLQSKRNNCGIIFVTSYEQYKDEAFGKNVIAYIDKNDLDRIGEVLSKIERNDSDFDFLKIGSTIIDTKDILYLKANGGYVDIISHFKDYMFYGTLFDMHKKINNKHFVQIHRSYIVNLKYVENRAFNYVVLKSNNKLPISRKYKNQFEQRYFKYLREG
ncbi:MAG: response regulator transcription factor [Erysipelotrichia bacterium]|nr:response regulator transcription factor [Erysipelotrichia bacterium]NCC54818.1 response regulator transcription factor [Erysipelotrichia bacterium]